MRNKFLIFLGIFIFMIIPKNVFAKEIYPFDITINNTSFTNMGASYNNTVSYNIATGESFTLNIVVSSYEYYPTSQYYTFDEYPYILVFFKTKNRPDEIGLVKNSSCNSSCFDINGTILKQVGTDAITGHYVYVMVLRSKKFSPNIGTQQSVYTIEDSFTFTNTRTEGAQAGRGFLFYSVLLTDSLDALNNSNIDINAMITNASNNTTAINNSISQQTTAITNAINNQISSINSAMSTQHQDLTNINNSLNNETAPTNNDVSGKATEWANKNANTQPISGMVLMPITLLNAYINGINATCSPYNLGSLYDTDLILPCINVSNYLGATLWGVIDVLFSGFMIYAMGKKFVKIFNDFTNLRDNQIDELYGGGN